MKFKTKKTVVVEEELDVDDQLYQEHSIEWQMADLILEGHLDRLSADLYHEDSYVVYRAAERINRAFKRADACLQLVRSGKFEI